MFLNRKEMIKKKIHHFLNNNPVVLKFIYGLIILNVLAIILESYNEIEFKYGQYFEYLEWVSVFIFSIEYLLRVWTADIEFKSESNSSSKLKFVFSSYGIIDLLAVLPFYLPIFFAFDLRVLRILRLFRLLRVFKLGRLSKSMKTIMSVLKETKSDLSITFFVAFILLILSSTLMYYFEGEVQPDKFENIGQALWWSVATLTTVGYGDVYPVTGVGKLLSAVIALIGIGFVALPTGILSSAFIKEIQNEKRNNKTNHCPNCGK